MGIKSYALYKNTLQWIGMHPIKNQTTIPKYSYLITSLCYQNHHVVTESQNHSKLWARTKCITMEKNYDFFVRHLAQLQNSGLNALQKKAPFITKKSNGFSIVSLGRAKCCTFLFCNLGKSNGFSSVSLGRAKCCTFLR